MGGVISEPIVKSLRLMPADRRRLMPIRMTRHLPLRIPLRLDQQCRVIGTRLRAVDSMHHEPLILHPPSLIPLVQAEQRSPHHGEAEDQTQPGRETFVGGITASVRVVR